MVIFTSHSPFYSFFLLFLADLMKILQNDKELSKLIDDDDWESLIAIKDSIT